MKGGMVEKIKEKGIGLIFAGIADRELMTLGKEKGTDCKRLNQFAIHLYPKLMKVQSRRDFEPCLEAMRLEFERKGLDDLYDEFCKRVLRILEERAWSDVISEAEEKNKWLNRETQINYGQIVVVAAFAPALVIGAFLLWNVFPQKVELESARTFLTTLVTACLAVLTLFGVLFRSYRSSFRERVNGLQKIHEQIYNKLEKLEERFDSAVTEDDTERLAVDMKSYFEAENAIDHGYAEISRTKLKAFVLTAIVLFSVVMTILWSLLGIVSLGDTTSQSVLIIPIMMFLSAIGLVCFFIASYAA